MKSSRKKTEKRSFFDVHASEGKKSSFWTVVRRVFYANNVINLRKKFRTRYPWIWAAGCIGVLLLIFFGIRGFSTKAEVQDFNPSTCLGTWAGPANAEGVPETIASSGVLFSASNSAMYASGTQIFCGGFLPPNYATSGVITNVGLTFVWQVGDTPASSTIASSSIEAPSFIPASSTASSTDISVGTSTTTSTDDTATTTATSAPTSTPATITPTSTASTSTDDTEDFATSTSTTTATTTPPATEATTTTPIAASSTSDDTPASDGSTPTPTSTPAPPPAVTPPPQAPPTSDDASTTTSLNPFRSFFAALIQPALADDSSTDATTTSDPSSSMVVAPPIFADLAPSSSSASTSLPASLPTSSVSSSTPVVPPPLPDENFLDVSYSTDGQTWISIGKVSDSNWQNFTVTLPVSDWSDLQNLQIRIEGIPTTQDPVPPVYLDGMFVEVHYDLPPPVLALGNTTSSPPGVQVADVSPNVMITLPPVPPPPTVPAPTIANIAKSDTNVAVTVQYVGDFYGPNPLYLFVYPAGTTANRNDADSAFTFAGTPQEGPSINGLAIAQGQFDPTTKQATVTIITPSPPDDSNIATGDMVPGTYDVDIAYFDSETWHLIPAQSFTWP